MSGSEGSTTQGDGPRKADPWVLQTTLEIREPPLDSELETLMEELEGELRDKFADADRRWIPSAVRSAMASAMEQSALGRARRGAESRDRLLRVLVALALRKLFEKKRRDIEDSVPLDAADAEKERDLQIRRLEEVCNAKQKCFDELIDELNRLGDGPQKDVYILLLERRYRARKWTYEEIQEKTGLSRYMVERARGTLEEHLVVIEDAGRRFSEQAGRA